jgi:hypothetical protein
MMRQIHVDVELEVFRVASSRPLLADSNQPHISIVAGLLLFPTQTAVVAHGAIDPYLELASLDANLTSCACWVHLDAEHVS